jgi:hypothetical protein
MILAPKIADTDPAAAFTLNFGRSTGRLVSVDGDGDLKKSTRMQELWITGDAAAVQSDAKVNFAFSQRPSAATKFVHLTGTFSGIENEPSTCVLTIRSNLNLRPE